MIMGDWLLVRLHILELIDVKPTTRIGRFIQSSIVSTISIIHNFRHPIEYVKMKNVTDTKTWKIKQSVFVESEIDAQVYRDLYADFLRYYFKYTPKSKKILDIGCGKLFYPLIGRYLDGEYFGCDPYDDGEEKDFEFKKGFAEKLPYEDDSFDTIFMFGVLDHLQYPFVSLMEAYKKLKKGGTFWLLSCYYNHNKVPKAYAIQHMNAFSKWQIIFALKLIYGYFNVKSFKGSKNVVYVKCVK